MSSVVATSFYAMLHANSDLTESFCCLVLKSDTNGWSRKEWFGTKYCSYEKIEQFGTIVIVNAPNWLLEKKGIINQISKVENDKV